MPDCNICNRLLDDPKEPGLSQDCGGDCLQCMAKVGDRECEVAVSSIIAGDPCDDWSLSELLTFNTAPPISDLSTEDPE